MARSDALALQCSHYLLLIMSALICKDLETNDSHSVLKQEARIVAGGTGWTAQTWGIRTLMLIMDGSDAQGQRVPLITIIRQDPPAIAGIITVRI